ncbi:MAG TPA: dienelactone hydrolase family protein [Gemmatimonadaceae bacterium]|nr:dienelactone hydrolase family protein [Gemmatimonadaceae bacterium]
MNSSPHQGQPVRSAGAKLENATAAMVMIHGRGATAESILTLVPAIDTPGFVYLAPQASGNTWYPNSFLSPIPSNEPGITSGLAAIDDLMARISAASIPPERTMLLGFSQGACLSLEYAARHARRYGGIAGLSGGLIGPDDTPRDYPGSFADTPVFLGCSDVDFHIPAERVHETALVLERMGASVTKRLYPGMGHIVNDDEVNAVREMMRVVAAG